MTAIRINGIAEMIPSSDGRLTLNIPINIRRKSGLRVITLPNGETGKAGKAHEPTPIQQALARGHRWLAMLESGEVSTLRELAIREGVDNSYITRMVNLTTLAPEIIAAILDDALPNNITLFELAVNLPVLWDEQFKRVFGEQAKDAPSSA
ncbi:MAG: LacI family transcriptional regulator [Gallionellaceae bacterium]